MNLVPVTFTDDENAQFYKGWQDTDRYWNGWPCLWVEHAILASIFLSYMESWPDEGAQAATLAYCLANKQQIEGAEVYPLPGFTFNVVEPGGMSRALAPAGKDAP